MVPGIPGLHISEMRQGLFVPALAGQGLAQPVLGIGRIGPGRMLFQQGLHTGHAFVQTARQYKIQPCLISGLFIGDGSGRVRRCRTGRAVCAGRRPCIVDRSRLFRTRGPGRRTCCRSGSGGRSHRLPFFGRIRGGCLCGRRFLCPGRHALPGSRGTGGRGGRGWCFFPGGAFVTCMHLLSFCNRLPRHFCGIIPHRSLILTG